MEDELLSFTVKIHNKNKVFYLSCQGVFQKNYHIYPNPPILLRFIFLSPLSGPLYWRNIFKTTIYMVSMDYRASDYSLKVVLIMIYFAIRFFIRLSHNHWVNLKNSIRRRSSGVERGSHKACVGGSIPPVATNFLITYKPAQSPKPCRVYENPTKNPGEF